MSFSVPITINTERVSITASPGQVPDFIQQGVGYMNNGSLAIDTNAPATQLWENGFAQSAVGALYGTTAVTGTDVFEAGVRRTSAGALVYVLGAPVSYSNGNPQGANGELCCI